MGGVTRRRANQVLQFLTGRGLIRTDRQRHVLTNDGLTYLASRDRAAVRMALGRWSARQRRPRNGRARDYAGSALRAVASQMEHRDALTGFAAALSAEAARSRDYGVLDLLPTSRSSIGYYYFGTNYCPTINAVLSRVLNALFELAYHMPNAAETVEAPYTAAERLTFLPQPVRIPADELSVRSCIEPHRGGISGESQCLLRAKV